MLEDALFRISGGRVGREAVRRRVRALSAQAAAYRRAGRDREALDAAWEAKRLCDRLPGPMDEGDLRALNSATRWLAVELFRTGATATGIEVSRDLVRAARSAVGVADVRRRDALGDGLYWLACLFDGAEEGSDELTTAQAALDAQREFYAEVPDLIRPGLAKALARVAELLEQRGEYAEALVALREASSLMREVIETKTDTYIGTLASYSARLARLSRLVDDQDLALDAAQEAVQAAREAAQHDADRHKKLLVSPLLALLNLQDAKYNKPIPQPSLECVETSEELVRVRRGIVAREPSDENKRQLAATLYDFAKFADVAGNWGEAIATTREAISIFRPLADDAAEADRAHLGMLLTRYAFVLLRARRNDEALAACEEARGLFLSATLPDFTQLGRLGGAKTILLARQGKRAAAIANAREQIDFLSTAELDVPTHYVIGYLGSAWLVLSELLAKDGQAEESARARQRADEYRKRNGAAP